jgi:hypothetical protein
MHMKCQRSLAEPLEELSGQWRQAVSSDVGADPCVRPRWSARMAFPEVRMGHRLERPVKGIAQRLAPILGLAESKAPPLRRKPL